MGPAVEGALLAEVRACALGAGVDAVGVAGVAPFLEAREAIVERKERGLHGGMVFTFGRPERATDPARLLEGARSIVVGARRYGDGGVTGAVGGGGVVARYVRQDEYGALRVGLEAVARLLRDRGFSSAVVMDDNRLVDRAAAVRAGLGWLGKNTMLLHPELGSWLVLGSVVTDAVLPVADSVVDDGCGGCSRCQSECPTGALDEAGVLDARRCLAWLVQAAGEFPREFRVALGDRLYGCDDCQVVCPVNDAAAVPGGEVSVEVGRPGLASRAPVVDVVAMLAADDDALMEEFGHWYVPRRRPEFLRRNALLVLGNVADGDDPAVERVLGSSLASESDVVRAHAVWAARRLGRDDLLTAVRGDADEGVQRELAAAVPRRW